jgi:hypothetical protein
MATSLPTCRFNRGPGTPSIALTCSNTLPSMSFAPPFGMSSTTLRRAELSASSCPTWNTSLGNTLLVPTATRNAIPKREPAWRAAFSSRPTIFAASDVWPKESLMDVRYNPSPWSWATPAFSTFAAPSSTIRPNHDSMMLRSLAAGKIASELNANVLHDQRPPRLCRFVTAPPER